MSTMTLTMLSTLKVSKVILDTVSHIITAPRAHDNAVMMNTSQRRNNEQQQAAIILRKNLYEWDRMLRTPRGEDWPAMVGRLNAAMVRVLVVCAIIEAMQVSFICQCMLITVS